MGLELCGGKCILGLYTQQGHGMGLGSLVLGFDYGQLKLQICIKSIHSYKIYIQGMYIGKVGLELYGGNCILGCIHGKA